ncbi:cyclase family protein [Nostocoides sp. Soil756]|jgi:kynurenine formamidase|uniref:cyclase family protein n=1 Tax=Nostocoides sp. Soil756 TaxID=1736399 RepID=UPI0006FFE014|nr:cyclase family protein [Tetrasphaera sp. Soil756]KRE63678.1 cyclase [Tetrasphaera sp. Soil756]
MDHGTDHPVPPPLRPDERLTTTEFDELFDRLRRWDDDGTDVDERGALAGLSGQDRLRALAAATTGRAVSLSLPLNTVAGVDNPKPALHHMVDLGDVEEPEPSGHKDFIGIDYHGKATTHLDALCHIGYRGHLYGGRPSRDAYRSSGTSWAAVTQLADGLVLRGVLLDLPVVRREAWLAPGTAVHAADLLAAEEALGVRVGPGDAVLLRSGHGARRAAHGWWDSGAASAGWHVDAMPVLADRGIAVLGGDGDSDVRPSPVAGVHSPIHALALTALGIPLLDNLDLEPLAAACAEQGQYTFTLFVAPLVVPRGTGSPVNPIAVL